MKQNKIGLKLTQEFVFMLFSYMKFLIRCRVVLVSKFWNRIDSKLELRHVHRF